MSKAESTPPPPPPTLPVEAAGRPSWERCSLGGADREGPRVVEGEISEEEDRPRRCDPVDRLDKKAVLALWTATSFAASLVKVRPLLLEGKGSPSRSPAGMDGTASGVAGLDPSGVMKPGVRSPSDMFSDIGQTGSSNSSCGVEGLHRRNTALAQDMLAGDAVGGHTKSLAHLH